MRYLVLSDIHANKEALEAVLEAAPADTYDRVIFLGDLVGYGADPNAVVDIVRGLDPIVSIRGNHDKVASGVESGEGFSSAAREAALWTLRTLTPENRKYLAELPEGPLIVDDVIEVCHGAPFDEDTYIFDSLDALRAVRLTRRPVCFFGHTHLPVIFTLIDDAFDVITGEDEAGARPVKLQREAKYLVNPGSVGQPRDAEPRAASALVDTVKMELSLRRTAYSIASAQAKILAAGLPSSLAHRLALGR